MIDRTKFHRRCLKEGLRQYISGETLYWRDPLQYLLWWTDGRVLLLPNTAGALRLGHRRVSAVATFDDLDEAITTYSILNP